MAQIVARLGGALHGQGETPIQRIAPLATAGAGDISFLAHARMAAQLAACQADCVIVSPEFATQAARFAAAIVVEQPYRYYAQLSQWFAQAQQVPHVPGVDALARVSPKAHVHASACIGPFCVVEEDAVIAANVVLGAGCYVGQAAQIGEGTQFAPRVTLLARCQVGARCTLHAGVVIGADGFGFVRDEAGHGIKIAQLGTVLIGDDVEIGANTTIDRAALDATCIEQGVKIDNQVQIGHGVRIGVHTAIAGCVGIAGSAVIGAHCFVGGGAGILGPLHICDGVTISAFTLVMSSIETPGQFSGVWPQQAHRDWQRTAAMLRDLPRWREVLRVAKAHVDASEAAPFDAPDVASTATHKPPRG